MERAREGGSDPQPFRVRMVRGEPYRVRGRTLTPVARTVGFGRAQGTLAKQGVSGWGMGFGRVTPVATAEETAEGERSVAIYDATAAALRGLLGTAAGVLLALAVARWLAGRIRAREGGNDHVAEQAV